MKMLWQWFVGLYQRLFGSRKVVQPEVTIAPAEAEANPAPITRALPPLVETEPRRNGRISLTGRQRAHIIGLARWLGRYVCEHLADCPLCGRHEALNNGGCRCPDGRPDSDLVLVTTAKGDVIARVSVVSGVVVRDVSRITTPFKPRDIKIKIKIKIEFENTISAARKGGAAHLQTPLTNLHAII